MFHFFCFIINWKITFWQNYMVYMSIIKEIFL